MKLAIDVSLAFHLCRMMRNRLLVALEMPAMVGSPMHQAMHAIQMDSMHLMVLVPLVAAVTSLAVTVSQALRTR